MLGITDVDGLAVSMLATILLSFGVVLMLFACMAHNASKRDASVDSLLEEMERDEKSGKRVKAGRKEKDREPWEKDGDWWKAD